MGVHDDFFLYNILRTDMVKDPFISCIDRADPCISVKKNTNIDWTC